jgi:hypothetical protein
MEFVIRHQVLALLKGEAQLLWFGHAAEDTVKDAWMEFRHLHGRRGYRHRYYTLTF